MGSARSRTVLQYHQMSPIYDAQERELPVGGSVLRRGCWWDASTGYTDTNTQIVQDCPWQWQWVGRYGVYMPSQPVTPGYTPRSDQHHTLNLLNVKYSISKNN